MQNEEIELTIDAEGKVSVAVRRVKGKRCLELTRPLEEALGLKIEKRSHTSEYYESETRQQGRGIIQQK